MKYANDEFGYAGQMLPILINYMVIHRTLRDNPIDDQSYTCLPLIHHWRLMISIAFDNGSDTVGGSYYSAHQAVGKFV